MHLMQWELEINDLSKVLSIELPVKLYIYLFTQVYFKFIFLTILGIYIQTSIGLCAFNAPNAMKPKINDSSKKFIYLFAYSSLF